MLPGIERRPSFMVTFDFAGSTGAGGGGAGVGAAAGVGAGGGGGAGAGGGACGSPNCACAVHPARDAVAATRAVRSNGATIFRAIFDLLVGVELGLEFIATGSSVARFRLLDV